MKRPPRRVFVVDTESSESTNDELDIGLIVSEGSSSWTGPSPRVSQSRWAAAAEPRRRVGRSVRLVAFGVASAAVIVVGVAVAAVTVSPRGPAGSVIDLMSHEFAGSLGPMPSDLAQKPAPSVGHVPGGRVWGPGPVSGPALAPLPAQSPAPQHENEVQPLPSPSPSHSPTPEPSHTPDD